MAFIFIASIEDIVNAMPPNCTENVSILKQKSIINRSFNYLGFHEFGVTCVKICQMTNVDSGSHYH